MVPIYHLPNICETALQYIYKVTFKYNTTVHRTYIKQVIFLLYQSKTFILYPVHVFYIAPKLRDIRKMTPNKIMLLSPQDMSFGPQIKRSIEGFVSPLSLVY